MDDKIISTIFGIAFGIGCLLIFGGIGWAIYDLCIRTGVPTPFILIAEGVYLFTALGLFLSVPGSNGLE